MIPAALALLLLGVVGCEESVPTAVSEDLLPSAPKTLEVRLSWEEFATELQVFGGYGSPLDVGGGVLARRFQGSLDVRTLAKVGGVGRVVMVVDSTGATVTDSLAVFKGGRLVARFDTLLPGAPEESFTISAHRMLSDWDERSTTWTIAQDTAGQPTPWPLPGAEPSEPIGLGEWLPGQGDSVVIPLDSALLEAWAVDSVEVLRGVRVDMETEGRRLELGGLFFHYDLEPSVRQDTILTVPGILGRPTFIYAPDPGPPLTGIRLGGAPAWRTTISTSIPRELTGPEELCATLGCPFVLTPESVSHVSLVLSTRAVTPVGFQPIDSARVDVRTVLAPDRLPKAPLGESLVLIIPDFLGGVTVPPQAFRGEAGLGVALPITDFVRTLVAEPSGSGPAPPHTLALLSPFEPSSISFAEFIGPGEAGAPYVRLLITVADPVRLP